jgi:hypothetical protein
VPNPAGGVDRVARYGTEPAGSGMMGGGV